jgi:hypothetical protein
VQVAANINFANLGLVKSLSAGAIFRPKSRFQRFVKSRRLTIDYTVLADIGLYTMVIGVVLGFFLASHNMQNQYPWNLLIFVIISVGIVFAFIGVLGLGLRS